jgi:dienelactone hydrolase
MSMGGWLGAGWLNWGLGAAAVLGLALLAVGLNSLRGYTGHTVPRLDPETLSRLLEPGYRIAAPAGEGPFPVLLLFSGCDGPRDNMDRWAEMARGAGWATMVVDSHGPRGFDDWQIWRLICAGQLLTGQERAGDIAVAIDDALRLPFADGRVALFGASHGGWSVLDLLALHGRGEVPFNLTRWPESLARDGLAAVSGAILAYPYCGVMSRAQRDGWRHPVPVHFLLARNDAIADERQCETLARRMERRGLTVTLRTFEGVTHGFDQDERSALSPFTFSPAATSEALDLGRALLAGLAAEPRR